MIKYTLCRHSSRTVLAAWLVLALAAAELLGQRPAANRAAQNGEFFGAHMAGERLFLEIPAAALGIDFLIYQENARKQQVLRLDRKDHKVLLIQPTVQYAAGFPEPFRVLSRRGWIEPIVSVFPIEETREDGTVIIDVTTLFTTQVPGFISASVRLDSQRSFVETVRGFPRNLEIDAIHTRAEPSENYWERPTVRVHWSVVKLPDEPMRPRLFDPRMGFWMESRNDDGAIYSANTRGSIARWRLEKKHPSAELSEPVQPIVFYIDPATPKKWRRYIRQGVESWQPAFEAAGFKNAVIAKDPPDDPNWSVDDIRNSVVRWYERVQRDTVRGAGTANTVVDPRTGEILKANVHIPESQDLRLQEWYFTMLAPLDPRAQRFPLPDSLLGELYQFVVTHEIGHALGLRDGSYGKLAYPTDSLRSESFLRRMRFTPSVMNYARFNYVAQPEDSIPVSLLRQDVGPADIYSIMWGYKPIPDAASPDEETPTLDAWALIQDTVPWYRWVREKGGDPYTAYDAVDDADPVRSTGLGMKNLARVLEMLPNAALSSGRDNRRLEQLYLATLEQLRNEMRRVVAVVGGFYVQNKAGSQSGPVHTPLPGALQRAAVAFLDSVAFRAPGWLVKPEINRRFESKGATVRVMALQAEILGSLLNLGRLNSVTELEMLAQDPEEVYPLAELLEDVRMGLWAELLRTNIGVDSYRQSLQQVYLVIIGDLLKTPAGIPHAFISSEYSTPVAPQLQARERAVLRSELSTLHDQLDKAIPRSSESVTLAHLELMKQMVQQILEPAKEVWRDSP